MLVYIIFSCSDVIFEFFIRIFVKSKKKMKTLKRKRIEIANFVIMLPLLLSVGCDDKNKIKTPSEDESFEKAYSTIESATEECFDGDYFNMEYDDENNLVLVSLAFNGISSTLASDSSYASTGWVTVKSNLDDLSLVIKNQFKSSDYEINVAVMLLNEMDYDKTLYLNMNGEEKYDCID